jgi:enamine deaminase RidA (YjgF/YER057c/UK114 family)
MKTNTANIKVMKTNAEDYKEYYITLEMSNLKLEEIPEHIDELYRYIKSKSIYIIYENYYGHTKYSDYLLSYKSDLMAEYAIDKPPFLYLEGKPACESPMSGIVLYGIETKTESGHDKPALERVYESDDLVGTLIKRKNGEELSLMSVTGCSSGKRSALDFVDETREVYAKINRVLTRCGFSIRNIVRTNFYIPELLENYGLFNQCREEFFRSHADNLGSYPASTCIKANSMHNSQIVANIIAVKSEFDLEVEPIRTGKQCEAPEYGKLFSRGMMLSSDKFSRVYISGTASINRNGESVFQDLPREQMMFTIECVQELLKNSNMTFDDVTASTIYMKRKEDFTVFQEVRQKSAIRNIPMVCAIADVCRDELLFEMDLIAHKEK